jgi:hypothetical protein
MLTAKVYLQTNHASLGLGSPTFITDMWADENLVI